LKDLTGGGGDVNWVPVFGGNMLGWVPVWVLIAAVLMLVSVIGVILWAVKAHLDDQEKPDNNLPPML
jgi:hypothetical protein